MRRTVAPIVAAGGLLLLSRVAFGQSAGTAPVGISAVTAGGFFNTPPMDLESDVTAATSSLDSLIRWLPGGVHTNTTIGNSAAVTYTYRGAGTVTTPVSGNFSGTNFTASLGATAAKTPASTSADTPVFNGGASYTATDDITSLVKLQALTLGSTGSAAVIVAASATSETSNTLGFSNTTSAAINLNNAAAAAIGLNLTLSGPTTVSGTGSATVSGVVSGSGSLINARSGALTLTGANTCTGGTTI